MSFKYRWKNGTPPSRDQAVKDTNLLDESQFDNEQDHKLAEEDARKKLGVPAPTLDEDRSILPSAPPPDKKM